MAFDMRRCLVMLILLGGIVGADEGTTAAPKRRKRITIDRFFNGTVKKLDKKKKRIVLFYDFEDPKQLLDFEEVRPPRLLDVVSNDVSIRKGRLVLRGSSGIRHKIEGTARYRAHFWVKIGRKRNIGAHFTEPLLSEHYILLNLFDYRIYEGGLLHLCAIGLHEDEGADVDRSLVNHRDLFISPRLKKVKVGDELEVEMTKDGRHEFVRVNEVKGRSSSKGKMRSLKAYQFGLFVHESEASFDNLTLDLEVTDTFLRMNDVLLAMGGTNAIDVDGYPQLSLEDVVRLDPEAIIVIVPGPSQPADPVAAAGALGTLEISAVRDGRVAWLTHPDVFVPSSGVVDVAREFRRVLRTLAETGP